MKTLGNKMKILRAQKGLNLKEFGKIVEISDTALSNIETGKTKYPGVDIAIKIADALETDIYYLFGNKDFNSEQKSFNDLQRTVSDYKEELFQLNYKLYSESLNYLSKLLQYNRLLFNYDDEKAKEYEAKAEELSIEIFHQIKNMNRDLLSCISKGYIDKKRIESLQNIVSMLSFDEPYDKMLFDFFEKSHSISS